MATASFPSRTSIPRRDTKAWQFQVWASFLVATFLCGTGLAWLPGEAMERVFMVMGYVFCLSAVFVLAKYIRDREATVESGAVSADTPMWSLVVWGGFVIAMGLTGWGLLRMAIDPTYKAFLAIGWLYLISAAFTLAKMLRDRHECDVAEAAAGRSSHE